MAKSYSLRKLLLSQDQFRLFLLLFLPLLLLSLLLGALDGQTQIRQKEKQIKEQVQNEILLQARIAGANLRLLFADLLFLAEDDTVERVAENPHHPPENYPHLCTMILDFVRRKGIYDQIRILDLDGKELLRANFANGQCQIVPPEKLQNKKDRYYFHEGMQLEAGEIYISPFDLNMEQGQVERPFKPTIRLVTPIYHAGKKSGLMVLNYLGRNLLDVLAVNPRALPAKFCLLNRDGYWLKGETPEQEWGFMFPDKGKENLAHQVPKLWREIQSKAQGQYQGASGFYVYSTLYPLLFQADEEEGMALEDKKDYAWILLSRIPNEWFSAMKAQVYSRLLVFGCVVWLLLGAISFVAAAVVNRYKISKEQLQSSEVVQRSLMEHQAFLQSVLDGLNIQLAVLNDEGDIFLTNSVWDNCAQKAAPAEHDRFPMGTPVVSAYRQLDLEKFPEKESIAAGIQSVLEGKQPCYAREYYSDAQDRWYEVQVTLFPHRESNWVLLAHEDITERKRYEDLLREDATHDKLTGLYNRRFFDESLTEAVSLAQRHHHSLALCVCDIDKFKTVNDTKGHQVGDEVIAGFAHLIRSVVRQSDICTRFGGDEFCILFPHTEAEGAKIVVERLRERFCNHIFLDSQREPFQVSGSFGIAQIEPGMEPETLLNHADAALYAAKQQGRNQVALYQPGFSKENG